MFIYYYYEFSPSCVLCNLADNSVSKCIYIYCYLLFLFSSTYLFVVSYWLILWKCYVVFIKNMQIFLFYVFFLTFFLFPTTLNFIICSFLLIIIFIYLFIFVVGSYVDTTDTSSFFQN